MSQIDSKQSLLTDEYLRDATEEGGFNIKEEPLHADYDEDGEEMKVEPLIKKDYDYAKVKQEAGVPQENSAMKAMVDELQKTLREQSAAAKTAEERIR